MARCNVAHSSAKLFAHSAGVLQNGVFADVVKNRLSGSHGNRVSGKRVEVGVILCKRIEDLALYCHGRARNAVCHGLAHSYDIGHDTMTRKAPEGIAGTAEPWLHLIGNVYATFLVNQINNWFQEARRTRNNAIGRKDAIKQHAGKLDAVATHVLNLDGNLLAHPCAQIVGFQPERVRGRDHAHGPAHGNAFTDRRGETRDQSRIAVVRFAGNDDSLTACIKLSAAHRQVIGLRT